MVLPYIVLDFQALYTFLSTFPFYSPSEAMDAQALYLIAKAQVLYVCGRAYGCVFLGRIIQERKKMVTFKLAIFGLY